MIRDFTTKKWTLEEYHQLGKSGLLQDRPYELLEGEIVEMSPVGIRHKDCVSRVVRAFYKQLGELAQLESQQPLVVGNEEPIPDIFLLRPQSNFYQGQSFMVGDALLIIEVAESTLKTDQEIKVPKYARFSVPEVWVVDLNSDKVWVYRNPKDGAYTQIQALERGSSLSVQALPQVQLTVEDVLGKL